MKKKVFRRLKRRAFNNTLSNAHSMPNVGDDKENIRPDTQDSEGPANIAKTCEKSRVIRHPLGHKQQTATTFSFNNQATCSDDYAFLQTANKQGTHNSTVTLKMIRYDPYQPEESVIRVMKRSSHEVKVETLMHLVTHA